MDILFVTPSSSPTLRNESIGTLILSKKAQLAGFSVKILRFWEIENKDYNSFEKEAIDKIINDNPKVVSFYCRGNEYHILIDLAMLIKKKSPNTIVVFGGPQAELAAKDTLHFFKSVDYICCGEGENTIVPLLNLLVNPYAAINKDQIPGLVFRTKTGLIKSNDLPEMLPDNYCRSYMYYDLIPENVLKQSSSVSIDVGRGCPFSCTFCSTFWKQRFRLRNLTDIINEINYVSENYGNKLFSFSHDHFTVSKRRVHNFCQLIKELKNKIQWTCSSRIDCVDFGILEEMANAGLVSIYYGIETGSSKIQEKINKRLNTQTCEEIVNYSIKLGISVTTSFIYGFPEETYDDLDQTLSLIVKLMCSGADVQLHILTFERGSALYEKYKRDLVYKRGVSNDEFGVSELSTSIKSHPSVFSTFFDYQSQLRDEMKYLHTIHNIGREYPHTYTNILIYLHNKGNDYVTIYKLFIEILEDSLERFERKHTKLSKAICYFMLEKLKYKITSTVILEKLGLTDIDANYIKKILII